MKLVAIPVIIKKREGGYLIHTQTRHVINKSYDPLYDGTEETCGETVKVAENGWGENIVDAAIRGAKEEMGVPDLQILRMMGGSGKIFETQPGKDEILGIEPYYYLQQMKGPQPWVGLGFILEVPKDFEPKLDKEGEVSGHRWWDPVELKEELKKNPSNFMGFHYPLLVKVADDILLEKILL